MTHDREQVRQWSCLILMAYLSVAGCSYPTRRAPGADGSGTFPATRLCTLLEGATRGEKTPRTVAGIFVAETLFEYLYDPDQKLCRLDVQPRTGLEFAPGVKRPRRLVELLDKDGRAYVTLRGTFWGPGVVGPDDPSLPLALAFSNRVGSARFGARKAWRTKFVIEEVTSIGIVRAEIEHAEVTVTRPKSAIPELQESALPRYPSAARDFGIQGKVVVEVTVQAGRVKSAKVQSGDRMLSGETVRTIESWRFKEDADAVFTTTFIYNLEVRRVGADMNARLDLRLPLLVEITATAGGW